MDKRFAQLEQDTDLSSSLVLAFYAIRSFYKHNLGKLGALDNEVPTVWPTKHKLGLRNDQLGEILKVATHLHHKTYILCQIYSGLSVSDLRTLPAGMIRKQIDQDIIHLHLLRGKEKMLGYFDTFFGGLAVPTLRKYLEDYSGNFVICLKACK